MTLIEGSHGRRSIESGASALHYTGITVLAAFIVGAIVTAVAPGVVLGAFLNAVCDIIGGKDCPNAVSAPATRQLTPLERAVAGTVWQGGDSYASGEGILKYDEETDVEGTNGEPRNMCHRSPGSYQAQVFRHFQGRGYFQGQDYKSYACSGSTVSNLHKNNGQGNNEGPQGRTREAEANSSAHYDKIPADASLITMSLGGNDVGFGAVLGECIEKETRELCMNSDAVRARMVTVYGDGKGTVGTLERQIRTIKAQHPDARIVLVGYPPLFAERWKVADLPIYTNGMDLNEQRWANGEAVVMNQHIKAMAERTGVEFFDPTPAFVGEGYDHRVGSAYQWINGLDVNFFKGGPEPHSFHPNQAGHDAMAGLLIQHIEEGPK